MGGLYHCSWGVYVISFVVKMDHGYGDGFVSLITDSLTTICFWKRLYNKNMTTVRYSKKYDRFCLTIDYMSKVHLKSVCLTQCSINWT